MDTNVLMYQYQNQLLVSMQMTRWRLQSVELIKRYIDTEISSSMESLVPLSLVHINISFHKKGLRKSVPMNKIKLVQDTQLPKLFFFTE